MIAVAPRLWVGSQDDYENKVKRPRAPLSPPWSVLHAAKEPYHRDALKYTTRSLPPNHKHYLYIRQGDHALSLNLIDADDPKYIHPEVISAALSFVTERLHAGDNVLVHCNQGRSRAPSIALLYLVKSGLLPKEDVVDSFKKVYPPYEPNDGMREYVRKALES